MSVAPKTDLRGLLAADAGESREEFMAQKFTNLEEAATQLGISKDRLNQLREAGKLRAYRDGASWKFRSDDIDKMARDGIPQIDPGASDLALDLDDDAASAGDSAQTSTPASDLNLDEIDEPTVAGLEDEGSDALAINLDDDAISLSDSILLSEADLGSSPGRPPSTIIGRAELDRDADLDLSPTGNAEGPVSDVKLAPGSDILPAGDDDLEDLPSPSGDFAGLDELEVDLEAESSRIMSPDNVAKARSAAAKKPAEMSDLELAASDSDAARGASDIGLASGAASGAGLTGLSALELEDDDDQVLGDGSDVTLSGESSGINIISPSDSGLALDEVALDLSGSTPMGSGLDLGDVSAADSAVGAAGSRVGEDFQLTPLGEGTDEEKDSSQVIALDELSEESAGTPLGAPVSESGMLTEDFGVGLAPGAMVVADATAETPFSMWNVMGLASCLLLLGLCGMMLFDLVRNMWSWEQGVSGTSSMLLEVLNPFL
jgi:excisionase family DNA binding protein